MLGGGLAVLGIVGMWMPGGLMSRTGSAAIGPSATLAGLAVALAGFLWPVRGYLRRAEAAGAISPVVCRTTLRNMLLAAGFLPRQRLPAS